MINRVSSNVAPIKTDLRAIKNNNLSFKANETDDEDDYYVSNANNNNQKFNTNKAFERFVSGFISPITQVVENIKTPGGAAITAGSLLFVKNLLKNVPQLKKPLIVTTASFGVLNFGIGIKNIIKNKNNPEAQEENFYNLGKGTALVGLSGVFAPKALLSQGVTNAKVEALPLIKGKPLPLIGSAEMQITKETELNFANCSRALIQSAKETPKALMNGAIAIKNNPKLLTEFLLPKNVKSAVTELCQSVVANDISPVHDVDVATCSLGDPDFSDAIAQVISGEASKLQKSK